MPEEVSSNGCHQDDGPLTLRVQRMNADRLTVVVDSPQTMVEALREKIRQQTDIPVERQRIIFRGRVLKDGERLSHYDVHNESVLHLVERPEASTGTPSAPGASDSSGRHAASSGPRPGLAGATANILLHTMQVDPSAGPVAMAQEISRSMMEALRGVINETELGSVEEASLPGALFSNLFGPFSTNATASGSTGRDSAGAGGNAHPATGGRFDPFASSAPVFTAGNGTNVRPTGTSPAQPTGTAPTASSSSATVQSRLFSRPTSAVRSQPVTSPPAASSTLFPSTSHQTVRTDPQRALHNLNEDLRRLTTFADGSDLFLSTTQPAAALGTGQDQASDLQLLISNLEHFERAYWMLAGGCRELREALQHPATPAGGTAVLPWDRLANLMALLHELPLLMISQRRLLGSLRAVPPRGTVELPPSLDVPSFLAREGGNGSMDYSNNNSNGNNTTGTTAPSPNPMDIIEPPE